MSNPAKGYGRQDGWWAYELCSGCGVEKGVLQLDTASIVVVRVSVGSELQGLERVALPIPLRCRPLLLQQRIVPLDLGRSTQADVLRHMVVGQGIGSQFIARR